MKNLKINKETFLLMLIAALSAVLNFVNLGIEGYGNSYYAAAVKSMTLSLKNFFFVSYDPAGFVTIDKPPLGFMFQAISAKIFGYSGWSIILPQALAGVISVITIYYIVKRAFGSAAGLMSSLLLAVTPVFVAVSRNNTVDNLLVMVLLFACLALLKAAEKGKIKYLIISMVLVGIGFNIKMLQAYLVGPALYITYLLSTSTSIKKRIIHLVAGTVVLIAVSLSWALIVDSVQASMRPYIDSSTNNTVMELITGHNGLERISLSSKNKSGGGPGGNMQPPSQSENSNNSDSKTTQNQSGTDSNKDSQSSRSQSKQSFPGNPPSNGDGKGMPGQASNGGGQMGPGGNGMQPPSGMGAGDNGMQPPTGNGGDGMQPPSGGGPGGGGPGGNGLQGVFGGETKSSITRLFSKNILSDQIVWFIPLAVLGFIAAAIKEKLKIKLDNNRKQSLVLWFMWFLPAFIYFSYNTGTFHSYYLVMLAPPVAALAGIGLSSMWELYKEGGWKAWFLPTALIVNGAVHLLMLYYFISSSSIIKVLMAIVSVLCFISSLLLIIMNLSKNKECYFERNANNRFKKLLLGLALAGILVTPLVGSGAAMVYPLNNSFPAAGLELLSSGSSQNKKVEVTSNENKETTTKDNSNSKLIEFLLKNKTEKQKYLLVVSTSNDGSDIIIKTGEAVMSLGGFLGNNNAITLDQFKELVKNGEVRYVMAGDGRGGNSSEIMNWVKENGKLVSSSEYSNANTQDTQTDTSSESSGNQKHDGFGGMGSGQLYDLKAYTDSAAK